MALNDAKKDSRWDDIISTSFNINSRETEIIKDLHTPLKKFIILVYLKNNKVFLTKGWYFFSGNNSSNITNTITRALKNNFIDEFFRYFDGRKIYTVLLQVRFFEAKKFQRFGRLTKRD